MQNNMLNIGDPMGCPASLEGLPLPSGLCLSRDEELWLVQQIRSQAAARLMSGAFASAPARSSRTAANPPGLDQPCPPDPQDMPLTTLSSKFGSKIGQSSGLANNKVIASTQAKQLMQDPQQKRVKKKGRLHPTEVLEKNITTVMMHQLAPHFPQKALLRALDEEGFKGFYDYVYVPSLRPDAPPEQRGYAFINLINAEVAAALVSKWAGRRFSDDSGCPQGIFFSLAAVQGLEANLKQFHKGKGGHRGRPPVGNMPYIAGSAVGDITSF
mmetsp:Transcript_66132/g.158197  ORF Transcript_66132/g.158197 Transcript_66132/m.158197 type:complete len:270 (+) Transcript_66132:175-984(+)